jgi:outer membrane receptor for monomeric catechols
VAALTRRDEASCTIHIEDIQDQVELADACRASRVARAYVLIAKDGLGETLVLTSMI